jgi:hypothetical protein
MPQQTACSADARAVNGAGRVYVNELEAKWLERTDQCFTNAAIHTTALAIKRLRRARSDIERLQPSDAEEPTNSSAGENR